jgi:hypothetical protein
MPATFEKLNLKGQNPIVVLNAPESFEAELRTVRGVKVVRALSDVDVVEFSLAFVTTLKEVETAAKVLAKKAKGDAVVWFAYPKGSSKKHSCEFNRDTGWQALGNAGFEPVRMVAIDEDWSATRFRRVEFIKTMTRDKEHRLTAQGRARATKA